MVERIKKMIDPNLDQVHIDESNKIGVQQLCASNVVSENTLHNVQGKTLNYLKNCLEKTYGPMGSYTIILRGDNPQTIAATAVRAVKLGAKSIDINFGCPSRFVHHGGAMLLKEPDLMHEIVSTVRDALLPEIFLSVKVRTGFLSKEEAPEIVSAIAVDGVDEIIMHARTRKDLYSEAALDWSVIGRVSEYAHGIPMVANGDILSFEDGQQCSEAAKTDRLMVGRGALSIPNAGAVLKDGAEPYTTSEVLKVVDEFIQELISRRFQEKSVLDRAKQFLGFARRTDKKLVEFFKLFCRENSVDKARKLIETSISQYDN